MMTALYTIFIADHVHDYYSCLTSSIVDEYDFVFWRRHVILRTLFNSKLPPKSLHPRIYGTIDTYTQGKHSMYE